MRPLAFLGRLPETTAEAMKAGAAAFREALDAKPQEDENFGLHGRRFIALIISAIFLVAIFLGTARVAWTNESVRIAFDAIIVVSLFVLLCFSARPHFESCELGPPISVSPAKAEIDEAVNDVATNYSTDAIRFLLDMLLSFPAYLSRANEQVELNGRKLIVDTVLQYRLNPFDSPAQQPAEADGDSPTTGHTANQQVAYRDPQNRGTVLVLLATAQRGLLFDGFHAEDADGRSLSILSQWEARALAAMTIRSLFYLARASSANPAGGSDLSNDDRRIMDNVIENAVCSVGGVSKHDRRSKNNLLAEHALASIGQLGADFDASWKTKIELICRTLASSYLIIAEAQVPEARNIVVRYRSQYSPERMNSSPYERRRAKLGLGPYTVDVPMTRAFHADSYHFELNAPAGQYVFSHHLEELGTRKPLRQEAMKIGERQQYVRLYHEDGRSNAHLYVRRHGAKFDLQKTEQSELRLPSFKSIVHLREVPPGTIGNVTTLAIATASITLFFALTLAGFSKSNSVADVPALILALPAFIASALGRNISSEMLNTASLMAVYGIRIVAFSSIASALIYVFEIQHPERIPAVTLSAFGHRLHTNVAWLALLLLLLTTLVFLSWEKRRQTRYYMLLLANAALATNMRSIYNGGINDE